MDKELEAYYEERFVMFSSKGWKDLIEDVEAMLVSTNSLSGVNTESELHFKKGEVSIMQWLLTLEDSSREAYRLINEGE